MVLEPYLDEEAILLGEFNHRLFNTLQVISSLVARCGRAEAPASMQPMLGDLDFRLQALGRMHRMLARPPETAGFEDYCRTLCALLLQAFGRSDVTSSVQMEKLPLRQDQTYRLALAIVELVTNVLKHSLATPGGGTVWVDLRERSSLVELCVCDSGQAPTCGIDAPSSHVVGALARCLDGEAFVADRGGYAAGIRFPLTPSPQALLRRSRRLRWTGNAAMRASA